MEGIRFNSKLIREERINEDTKVLDFSVPANFEFTAGQYVRMAFYKDGKRILRDYSIISSPSEGREGKISIYFKKVNNGYASNKLFNMKVGEEIEMKGPLGNFVLRNLSKDLVFISSGTGFGPLWSMIKDLKDKKYNGKIILIRSYRKENGLLYEEKIRSFESENFKYYGVLSQPENKNYKFKGRVQDFLEEIIPKEFRGSFYLCGLSDMIEEVRSKLSSMGVSEDRILFEKYD